MDRRSKFIIDAVRDWSCGGVVVDRLSFCAIWAAEAWVLRRRLREAGIPMLELEGELGGSGEGQLRTRLEAFAEQIRNRGER
jgi:benzoyl-CoA reductase/2-hydroxyglutaryl-CoA dehydratase subunit BcrC/BadD/HgdB